jgi:hypothetical protein
MRRVLVFCTSYVRHPVEWHLRYRRWYEYHRRVFAGIGDIEPVFAMVDDCSPYLPDSASSPYLKIYEAGNAHPADSGGQRDNLSLYRFPTHLGRAAVGDYAGWFRSFTFSAHLARALDAQSVLHIESDSFLLTRKARDALLAVQDGWLAFWCPRYDFAETCFQAIAGTQLEALTAMAKRDYASELAGQLAEQFLPITHVERGLVGDRYGEYIDTVPEGADYASQITPYTRLRSEFFAHA